METPERPAEQPEGEPVEPDEVREDDDELEPELVPDDPAEDDGDDRVLAEDDPAANGTAE